MKAKSFPVQTDMTYAGDCTWDGLLPDVVWDYQTRSWDGPGIWYVWGPDPPLAGVWTPDVGLKPC